MVDVLNEFCCMLYRHVEQYYLVFPILTTASITLATMLEFQNQFGQDERCFEAEGAKLVRQRAPLKQKLRHYTTGDKESTQDYCVSPLKLGFQSAWKRVSPAEREVFKARLTPR